MTDLPPAGWYDDPTSPVQERWWDGEKWTEETRRKAAPVAEHRVGDLRPVGDYLGHTFTLIRREWDSFLLIAVIGAVLMAVASAALIKPIIDALTITGTEILGFEASHAVNLVVFLVLLFVVSLVIAVAQYWIAWRAAVEEAAGWASALQYGLRNFIRFLGWMIAAFAPLLIGLFVVVVIARAAGSFGAIVLLAAFVAGAWWSIVIAFVPAAIVVDNPNSTPIAGAIATVRGRWWRIFGRLLVIGLIAGLVINVVTAIFGQVAGAAAFGIEFQVTDSGDIELVKNVGNSLEFFLAALIFFAVSLVGNVASFCAVTSIAYDVMPRSRGAGEPGGGADLSDFV